MDAVNTMKNNLILLLECWLTEGLSLPTDEWVKAMQSLNEKTRLLQEEFEAECVKYKVGWTRCMNLC